MNNLQTIINRIVTEQAFREALAKDAANTLQDAGFEPTAQLLAAFDGLDLASIREDVQYLC